MPIDVTLPSTVYLTSEQALHFGIALINAATQTRLIRESDEARLLRESDEAVSKAMMETELSRANVRRI